MNQLLKTDSFNTDSFNTDLIKNDSLKTDSSKTYLFKTDSSNKPKKCYNITDNPLFIKKSKEFTDYYNELRNYSCCDESSCKDLADAYQNGIYMCDDAYRIITSDENISDKGVPKSRVACNAIRRDFTNIYNKYSVGGKKSKSYKKGNRKSNKTNKTNKTNKKRNRTRTNKKHIK
jgi:hypothetical protein